MNTATQALHAAVNLVHAGMHARVHHAQPQSQFHNPKSTCKQVGNAWLSIGRPAAAEWPFQQLRERLTLLEALGSDPCQPDEVRCAVQLLQFHTLQGSIVLAGNAGHKALWSNLVARMQQLLESGLLPPADTAMLCQELADTLAAQAAASASGAGTAGAGRTPTQLLQCAEGLIGHSMQLVEVLAASEQGGGADNGGSAAELAAWTGQLRSAWVEVRLRTSEALLTEGGPAAARDAATEVLQHLMGDTSCSEPDPAAQGASTRAAKLLTGALLALGQQAEAAACLTEWLGTSCGTAEGAADALTAFTDACGLGLSAAAEGRQLCDLAAAAGRAFPGQHQPTMAIVQRLLTVQVNYYPPSAADGIALQLLDDAADAIIKAPAARARCHALLHARGAALHRTRHAPAARGLLSSALFFSPPGATRARTARQLAACCADLGQRAAALEYLAHAARDQAASGSVCVPGKLLELRVLLKLGSQEDGEAAGAASGAAPAENASQEEDGDGGDEVTGRICRAIDALAAGGPGPALGSNGQISRDQAMQIAYEECCAAGAWRLAWRVLDGWCSALARPSTAAAATARASAGGLFILGRMLFLWRRRRRDGKVANLSSEERVLSRAAEAAHLCASALTKPVKPATDKPGGDGSCRRQQQAGVAAGMARELGVAAVEARLWPAAAALLQAAAALLGAAGESAGNAADSSPAASDTNSDALMSARVDVLRAAAGALLMAHDGSPADSGLLRQAKDVMSQLQQLQPAPATDADAPAATTPDKSSDEQLLALKLDLLVATHDGASAKQRRLLASLSHHPAATAADALRVAAACLDRRPWRSEPVAMLALGFALRLAAERPAAAGYSGAAVVAADAAQRLLQLSKSCSVRVRVMDRVADVLNAQAAAAEAAGGGGGGDGGARDKPAAAAEFPRQQLSWLAACCWNWAVEAKAAGDEESAAAYRVCWRRLAKFLGGGDCSVATADPVSQQGSDGSGGSGTAGDDDGDGDAAAAAGGADGAASEGAAPVAAAAEAAGKQEDNQEEQQLAAEEEEEQQAASGPSNQQKLTQEEEEQVVASLGPGSPADSSEVAAGNEDGDPQAAAEGEGDAGGTEEEEGSGSDQDEVSQVQPTEPPALDSNEEAMQSESEGEDKEEVAAVEVGEQELPAAQTAEGEAATAQVAKAAAPSEAAVPEADSGPALEECEATAAATADGGPQEECAESASRPAKQARVEMSGADD
jgi:hypothetical protein